MHFLILSASIVALGVLVLLGLMRLVNELLIKEFFHPPSMPGENCQPDRQATGQTSSHSANRTAQG
jgi:hypothetical protein